VTVRVNREIPPRVNREVKAAPLSDSTIAGTPYWVNAAWMAVTAAAAVSASAAMLATRTRE
jgi:hypothetical protein